MRHLSRYEEAERAMADILLRDKIKNRAVHTSYDFVSEGPYPGKWTYYDASGKVIAVVNDTLGGKLQSAD